MARFDWKGTIQTIAVEVEGCLRYADAVGPKFDHGPRAEAARKAPYAFWLARSYSRKGIRKGEAAMSHAAQVRDALAMANGGAR